MSKQAPLPLALTLAEDETEATHRLSLRLTPHERLVLTADDLAGVGARAREWASQIFQFTRPASRL